MRTLIPVFFLVLVLGLLFVPLQQVCRRLLQRRPALIFAVPAFLAGAFCLVLGYYGALGIPIAALIAVYTFLPTAVVFLQGTRSGPPTWLDLAVIFFLWLPVELTVGRDLIPAPIRGLIHQAVYGVAVTLALVLFLLFRGLDGMKYRWPRSRGDFVNPLIGFAVVAPVLAALGLALHFIAPFHTGPTPAWLVTRYVLILVGVALPEEILFRALIQNWLFQRLGETNRVLLLAALIFGSAHLNNAPGPLPNWRYMILATIAGFVYGKVFQKGTSVFSSAFLHALVNTIRHGYF